MKYKNACPRYFLKYRVESLSLSFSWSASEVLSGLLCIMYCIPIQFRVFGDIAGNFNNNECKLADKKLKNPPLAGYE